MEMEKVVNGLECCSNAVSECGKNCPYWNIENCQSNMQADALALLKAQEPRVMTLEELEHAEIAYAEDKDKTDIIPVLVLGRMSEHVALVKPHVDEEAITRMIIPWRDDYGKRWRCWTSRPTDEQREAAKWELGWRN